MVIRLSLRLRGCYRSGRNSRFSRLAASPLSCLSDSLFLVRIFTSSMDILISIRVMEQQGMEYTIHFAGAIMATAVTMFVADTVGIAVPPLPIFVYAGAVAGGLLPDIDTPDSAVGKCVRPIARFLKRKIGHRTFTHSLLFCALAYPIGTILWRPQFGVGIAIGILSHIILDMLTPGTYGVALFYPFKKGRVTILLTFPAASQLRCQNLRRY